MPLLKTLSVSLTLLLSAPAMSAPAATVNGKNIEPEQVNHFIAKQKTSIPFEQAVEEMINLELLVQDAEKEGFTETDEMQLELDRVRSGIIASAWLKKRIDDMNISDKDIELVYQQQVLSRAAPEEFKARHILVETEAEAKDLIKELQQGGDFVELAKLHSTGPSAPRGGDLGWFAKETMVAPFANATSNMAKGQFSKTPVQTQFGWHVILLEDKRSKQPASLDSMRKQIATAIAAQKISEYLADLRSTASIN